MTARAARLLIPAVVLVTVAVLAPSLIGQRHPRPSPAAEAVRNLRVLKLLEERYFAEHGRYAPDPDGTARFDMGAAGIQAALPDFRPGPPERLLFVYSITSFDKGAKFAAEARGRTGTAAAGKRFSINQDSRDPEQVAAAGKSRSE